MITVSETKPKRRFAQFSLRTLLCAMLVAGLGLGWKVEQARRQRTAVSQVLRQGGMVGYAYEGPFVDSPHGINGPKLPKPAPEWLIQRLGIDYFDAVVSVGLPTNSVDLSELVRLSAIRRLDLNSAIDVSDIGQLRKLTRLEWLVLSGTDVADLTPLEDMMQLKVLYLGSTSVADISPIQKLTQLRSLDLSGTRVTDFSTLSAFTELQVLSLADTTISDVTPLQEMKDLGWLDLRKTAVTDLTPLRSLKGVRIILEASSPVPVRVPKELEAHVRRY